jgi:cyclophilin family peptidyl-prolyl cis-trans isomerase
MAVMRTTLFGITAALALLLAAPAFAQSVEPEAVNPLPPQPVSVEPAPSNPPMTGPKLLISTSMGDITLQLDAVRAPKSVANILAYVKRKHYDGTIVYRVAPGFVVQMGSWESATKGRSVFAAPVPLESNNGLHNLRGTVALAREEGPDTAKAEFFINLVDNFNLNRNPNDPGVNTGYAVFGQVIGGMDVVDAIGNVPVGDNGPMPGQAPVTPIPIKRIAVIK